jgi:hypothetical protein
LFICGSIDQTRRMHRIATEMLDCDHAFTPFFADGVIDLARRVRLLESTPLGEATRRRCLDYLEAHELPLDDGGREAPCDLVVTSSDLKVPRRLRGRPVVVVQEGLLDGMETRSRPWRALAFRWMVGGPTTGPSHRYDRFCTASEGCREVLVRRGGPSDRIAVTGIPYLDDCSRYRRNKFPYCGYVLACAANPRGTFSRRDGRAFLESCVALAAGRPLVFKVDAGENVERATAEIRAVAPSAFVICTGSTDEMIANCNVLIARTPFIALVGLMLGKEVHANVNLDALRKFVPAQDCGAARRIAMVCQDVLAARDSSPKALPSHLLEAS